MVEGAAGREGTCVRDVGVHRAVAFLHRVRGIEDMLRRTPCAHHMASLQTVVLVAWSCDGHGGFALDLGVGPGIPGSKDCLVAVHHV